MGTYNEGNAVERVWSRLRDYGNTNDQQLMNDAEVLAIGIRGAEPIYSRIAPREIVSDLTANGTNYLGVPTGFLEGFGSVLSIESPPDRVPAEVIDPRDWTIGRDGSGALRFVWSSPPANGAVVRVIFTGMRTMNAVAASTTVLDGDYTAFCDLAASLCADSISAKYARTSEPAFNADAVNFRTRSQEWQTVAKVLWTAWERGMGLSGGGADGAGGNIPPASAYANWDAKASWGGMYVNHPRQGR